MQKHKKKENTKKEQPLQKNQQSVIPKKLLDTDIEDKKKIIVILEQCPLEVAKLKKNFVLLNSDEHRNYISKKLHKDYSIYRPDIVHQCLLTLMDSPLNKAGYLKVYIRSDSGTIIDISANTKIPRTYKRFASLFAQLLIKLKIRAVESSETLLKIIKNPITQYIPDNCLKIGTSTKARLVNFKEFAQKMPQNSPICFVVGGVAKGNPGMEADYVDDSICVSRYSLSASCCLSRIIFTFEDLWNVQ